MVEREPPYYPTSFHLDRGSENGTAWRVTLHARGVANEIGHVVEN